MKRKSDGVHGGSQGMFSFDGFNYSGESDFWFSAETLGKILTAEEKL